jgi:tetratricopeptide (TPR) repeat protein
LVKELEGQYGADSPNLISILRQFAANAGRNELVEVATAQYERLEKLHTAHPDYDPVGRLTEIAQRGMMHYHRGDYEESKTYFERAVAGFSAVGLAESPGMPTTAEMVLCLLKTGNWDFGCEQTSLKKIKARFKVAKRFGEAASVAVSQGTANRNQNRTQEAREYFDEARTAMEKLLPKDHPILLHAIAASALNEAYSGEERAAIELLSRVIQPPAQTQHRAAKTLWTHVGSNALESFAHMKRWAEVVRLSNQMLAEDIGTTQDLRMMLSTEILRSRAFENLGEREKADLSLESANKLAIQLGPKIFSYAQAELALIRLWHAQQRRVPESTQKLLRDELRAARAQLKGEAYFFTKEADALNAVRTK